MAQHDGKKLRHNISTEMTQYFDQNLYLNVSTRFMTQYFDQILGDDSLKPPEKAAKWPENGIHYSCRKK